ncbi:hypothetical protein P7C73_g170, partial [Tremellales sp. Uapishka_1]
MTYPPTYPPSTSTQPLPAEEYELTDEPTDLHDPSSSTQPRASGSRPTKRTLTLHPNQSTSALLFPASPTRRLRHLRTSSVSKTPEVPSHFLSEEDHLTEEVHVPDFGQILGFRDEAEDHYAIAQGIRSRWKRKLYLLLEEPGSGREAFFVHVLVTGTIIFSAVLTTLSTLPSFHTDPTSTRLLFGLDTFIVVLFTVEYMARSLAHSSSWVQYYNWSASFFGLLDLLAILPYYIEVAQKQDTSILFRFSILRTFRLLRVFRAFKYQNQMLLTIEVMYVAVYRSKDALLALSFFILLVLIIFSTLIYFAERGTWDSTLGAFVDADGGPSSFESIPQAAWFSLVTMSTVGYGEVVPKSFLGKLLTVPLLMFGLLLIALPSFVLGRNFAIVFDAMTEKIQNPSKLNTPRTSLDVEVPPENEAPLLPTTVPKRATSPYPDPSRQPKMWDGGDGGDKKERDLTNVKLAKNQMVLLEQIDDLRKTIDRQGEVLALMMRRLDGDKDRGKEKAREDETQFRLASDDEGS